MTARPHGARVTCAIKIGNHTFYSEVKEGTQKLLGLQKTSGKLAHSVGKGKGVKGTQSYQLLLAKATTVGQHSGCVRVSLPVAPSVHLREFYAWAYKQAPLAGIITPAGIQYAWKTPAKRPKKNAIQKGLDAAGNLIKAVENAPGVVGDYVGQAAGQIGDYVQSAENAIGTVGGYIQGVEGLAGDVLTGAEALVGLL